MKLDGQIRSGLGLRSGLELGLGLGYGLGYSIVKTNSSRPKLKYEWVLVFKNQYVWHTF